jgi:hypothetical protein
MSTAGGSRVDHNCVDNVDELALLRRAFQTPCALRCLTPKARGRAASANWVGATRETISLGQEGEFKGAE